MIQKRQDKNSFTLKRNALTVECLCDGNGRLYQKTEYYDRQCVEYAYRYDIAGRLTGVRSDDIIVEQYRYNKHGQRAEQKREHYGLIDYTDGMLLYDDDGRLERAGGTSFYYDKRGALAERCDRQGITRYSYGEDTMPDKISLPSGAEIRYEYDKGNPVCPARRFRNDILTAELFWHNPLRMPRDSSDPDILHSPPLFLKGYRDYDNHLQYTFMHDKTGVLDKVRINVFRPERQNGNVGADWLLNMAIEERRERLHDFLSEHALPLELYCGCDQVGTPKILTTRSGRVVKEIMCDSFGLRLSDSFQDLFMPVGFAGGLQDQDTGLVRFGWRDYDPGVGRFTAPDPLGDTGGDHDLYDYCVDDPVNLLDPKGLKEKSFIRIILEKYSPLLFMEEGPEKEKIRQGINLTLEKRAIELAGGLQDILIINQKIPSFLPGPSNKQIEEMIERHKQRKKELQLRNEQYWRNY